MLSGATHWAMRFTVVAMSLCIRSGTEEPRYTVLDRWRSTSVVHGSRPKPR